MNEYNSEKQRLFGEINNHLLSDEKPSRYLKHLVSPVFYEHPFTMLTCLQDVEQQPQHHPEGNVWNHTLLVIDEAASRKTQASDARIFMWAALLHDIGKAVTTQVRKGKITAYSHDKAGAEMVREFLAGFADEPFITAVSMLVRWHMQILFVVNDMPVADIEGMRKTTDVRDVALLGLCDRLGRTRNNQAEERQNIATFLEKTGFGPK